MSNPMPYPNRKLSDEAQQCEKEGNIERAAELYAQSYELFTSSFVASRYIYCLRKLERAAQAVEFGRQAVKDNPTDKYVRSAYGWAGYDLYLKKSKATELHNVDEEEVGEIASNADFPFMQKVTRYILKDCNDPTDIFLRTKAVFALCREAKQREDWQVMYEFASQLDTSGLDTESKEWNGVKMMPDYQQWLYAMIKPLFHLERYEECKQLVDDAIERYPHDKQFHLYAARICAALGLVEEALHDLERIDMRFPKEWYIQRDIAEKYTQLQKSNEALLWFCKAASCPPSDLSKRFKIFLDMVHLLEDQEKLQEAYEHLQLALMIVEREKWLYPIKMITEQLAQFKRQYANSIALESFTQENWSTLLQRCKSFWYKTVDETQKHGSGQIKTIKEGRYGFIKTETDDIHFKLRDVIRGVSPMEGMEVTFDVVMSYDQGKNEYKPSAKNVRPVKRYN